MDEVTPLLSVLIPTWNRVDEVVRAVDSVGFWGDEVEIVVVDNASPPELFDRLAAAVGCLPQVRLFRNDSNLGMVRNWNRCIEHARGEWQGLLCSDDVYTPDGIARALALLRTLSEPALVIQTPELTQEEQRLSAGPTTVAGLGLPIASGNFWHRTVSATLVGFDERFEYSADAEFWYRVAATFPVVKVRQPFARYNIHGDNYMWATWERPDFLAQTELLARTVQCHCHGEGWSRSPEAERQLADDLWRTVSTILSNTALRSGKGQLFLRYLAEAVRMAGRGGRRGELLLLLGALCRDRVKLALKRALGRA